MTPYRAGAAFDWAALLRLIQTEFAFMHGRIDPPSSMLSLTEATLAAMPEVWVAGSPPIACMVLTPKADVLYLGKLAIARAHRGTGLARQLVAVADRRARELGLACVELQTRIELVENHAIFAALGFVETARTAHKGYDRPTTLTFRKSTGPA
jgi:GNAT superfamily N-acetyltransferase